MPNLLACVASVPVRAKILVARKFLGREREHSTSLARERLATNFHIVKFRRQWPSFICGPVDRNVIFFLFFFKENFADGISFCFIHRKNNVHNIRF